MIVVIGEILFDQFPDKSVLGGAPFNFAFHLKKMGLPVRFFSRVGNDALGRHILNFLERHEFDIDDIQTDSDHDTGTVRVAPTRNGHTFHITENVAWDYLTFDDRLGAAVKTGSDFLYFGSLIQRSPSGKHFMKQLSAMDLHRVTVFCDINLRPNAFSKETIHDSLDLCHILKLSREELEKIAFINHDNVPTSTKSDNMEPSNKIRFHPDDNKWQSDATEVALSQIRNVHNIDDIILTMGEKGSLWVSDSHPMEMEASSPDHFIDSVGAGDAYAAVCAAGYVAKAPIERTMALASWFSGQICGIQGALPDDESIYSPLKKMNNP